MTRNRTLPAPVDEIPCVLAPARVTPPLSWDTVFGRRGDLEIEIGCGKGLYLVQAARLRPDSDFVGVERAGKWFRRAVYRVDRSGLPNVRIVCTDAFDFLARWVPPGSAAAVHVYFPDPWPKHRHGGRRLLQDRLYRLAAQALSPSGAFLVGSDVEPYFRAAVAEIGATGLFDPEDWPADAPDRLPTNFSVKYEQEGRSLHYARFRLRAGMEAVPGPVVPSPAGEES
jgi:tRNA (guanine-N7-)-methyltransferase